MIFLPFLLFLLVLSMNRWHTLSIFEFSFLNYLYFQLFIILSFFLPYPLPKSWDILLDPESIESYFLWESWIGGSRLSFFMGYGVNPPINALFNDAIYFMSDLLWILRLWVEIKSKFLCSGMSFSGLGIGVLFIIWTDLSVSKLTLFGAILWRASTF